MVELRWVTIKKKKVLQWRRMSYRIDASGAITPMPLPIEWTEWQRVPSVATEKRKE